MHTIEVESGPTKDMSKSSFLIQDIIGLAGEDYKIIEIRDQFFPKMKRNKFCKLTILEAFINLYPKHIIVISAVIPSRRNIKKYLLMLDEYFKYWNFANINNYVQYETKQAYLYIGNTPGKDIYEKIKKELNKNAD